MSIDRSENLHSGFLSFKKMELEIVIYLLVKNNILL